MRVPVLFLVFNRPDTTQLVFEAIRRARPPRLYVAADGARVGRPDEAARCEQARRIATAVDWPCEVSTLFRDTNLGCKRAVSGGIDWFFGLEEEGIVLEDDVIPDPTFFRYAEELLERYRSNSEVMMISANHLQGAEHSAESSYVFSRYMHVWGWASWRRAWRNYDVAMSQWPAAKESGLLLRIGNDDRDFAAYWSRIFDATYDGRIDTWDYQWMFATMLQGGLAAAPAINLARNVGFSADATHTTDPNAQGADLPLGSLDFPLKHPSEVVRDTAGDEWEERHLFAIHARPPGRLRQLLRVIRAKIAAGSLPSRNAHP